jgi:hypothetical protein
VRSIYHEAVNNFRRLLHEISGNLDAVSPSLSPSISLESRPLLGALPLARIIPQEAHSSLDYAMGATCIASALFADTTAAQVAGATLGASLGCVCALSDHRLSAAKLIPIESHEVLDHLWGATAIAAPFVFGYWKKDPAVAALHVMAGAATILTALFTDYRVARRV